MGTYRTSRHFLVDAVQSVETKTIATDLGFINVRRGEWVVCGEGGERYILDDAFFRRTFESVEDARVPEAGSLQCALSAPGVVRVPAAVLLRRTACRGSSRRGSRALRGYGLSHARHR